jgi:uncharacterized protein YfkK (UPF0435 family)
MLLVAVLSPVEVEVDRLETLLFVVLRPVDRLPMLLVAVLKPVEVDVDRLSMLLVAVLRPVEVEVDKLETLLFVVLRPVDRLPMLLVAVLKPVEVEVDRLAIPLETEVDSEVSWLTFTASVGFTPAATLVRMTGDVAPTPPSVTLV